MLSKEELRKAKDRPIVSFGLDPNLYGEGSELLLQPWDGSTRSRFEKEWADQKARKDPAGFRWAIIQATVVDEDGAPYFDDKDKAWFMGNGKAGTGKAASMIESLIERICSLNGLTQEDVEGLAGNSEADQ